MQYYGAGHVNASLLLIPLVGFLTVGDPRMRGTVEAIQRDLMRNGLIDRCPSMSEVAGLPHGEASFLACSF